MRIVFYNSNNRNNIVFVTYHVGTRRVSLLDLAFPSTNAARRDSLHLRGKKY